jgi:protein BCP1
MRYVVPVNVEANGDGDDDDDSSTGSSVTVDDSDDDMDEGSDVTGEDDVNVPAMGDEEVKVEFEAFPPSDQDHSGLTALLVRLFHKENVNVTQLVDDVITHNYIGSVLKATSGEEGMDESDDEDNDETVYGVTTVVNISNATPATPSAKSKPLPTDSFKHDIRKYLKKFCDQPDLWNIVDNTSNCIGLLLTERFVNIPPLLAPPMLKCLNKEVESAVKKKMPYKFTHYLLISKSVCEVHKGKSPEDAEDLPPALDFLNAEDQVFQQHSDFVLSFAVPDSDDMVAGNWSKKDTALKQYRTIIVMTSDKYRKAVEKIAQIFNVNNMLNAMQ